MHWDGVIGWIGRHSIKPMSPHVPSKRGEVQPGWAVARLAMGAQAQAVVGERFSPAPGRQPCRPQRWLAALAFNHEFGTAPVLSLSIAGFSPGEACHAVVAMLLVAESLWATRLRQLSFTIQRGQHGYALDLVALHDD